MVGEFYRICDLCGFSFRASQTTKNWQGLYVCREDFEERHPQDFVKAKMDRQRVHDPRPEPPDTFISGSFELIYAPDGQQIVAPGDGADIVSPT